MLTFRGERKREKDEIELENCLVLFEGVHNGY